MLSCDRIESVKFIRGTLLPAKLAYYTIALLWLVRIIRSVLDNGGELLSLRFLCNNDNKPESVQEKETHIFLSDFEI